MFKHVRFFDTQPELVHEVQTTVEGGNYVFMSLAAKNKKPLPLWHTTHNGVVRWSKDSKINLDVDNETVVTADTAEARVHVTVSPKRKKTFSLEDYRGFRLDQEKVFATEKGVVKRYKLAIHPSAKAKITEVVTDAPNKDFLAAVEPGDYVTVWSVPDEHQKDFLHYPVQGWLSSKDIEKQEISFIHPPRMEVQTFSVADMSQLTAFGYYRKLVLQRK